MVVDHRRVKAAISWMVSEKEIYGDTPFVGR